MASPSLVAAQAALARARAEKAKQHYQQAQTTTASPGQMVVLLYDGALRFARSACKALDERNLEAAHHAICRVQDILQELDVTLDDNAGAVAVNLHRIYDYCVRRLIDANIRKDAAPIVEVIGHLESMLTAWQTAVAAVENTGTAGNADGAQVRIAGTK
jgi:flagellar protein FliS